MEPTAKSVDERLASLPEDVRVDMVSMDTLISQALLGFDRVLWEGKFWGGSDQQIIGYGHLSTTNSKGDVATREPTTPVTRTDRRPTPQISLE